VLQALRCLHSRARVRAALAGVLTHPLPQLLLSATTTADGDHSANSEAHCCGGRERGGVDALLRLLALFNTRTSSPTGVSCKRAPLFAAFGPVDLWALLWAWALSTSN
jgi:hypothetical protein